jgi:hypothetical protein
MTALLESNTNNIFTVFSVTSRIQGLSQEKGGFQVCASRIVTISRSVEGMTYDPVGTGISFIWK